MSVEFVDGPTVVDFVNDSETFERCVNEKFEELDSDRDGVLSRDELQKRIGKLSSTELELQSRDEIATLYDVLFDKFDEKRSGSIDRRGFVNLSREIMLAKARGIGNSPVSIILQEDSLLMKAVLRAKA
ncbi:troponin C, skeletal muscle-like [Dorcoceras hygrometricum]|uniref:Troponin C, skeletal muscle-like n=1 Tax=Dorcoceras hygrometricum TaxID=472368 RepID=A0A2Z7CLU5_9LAMI|nr:troponin C, skeletal muscle-like [Dorcoceras hygrometricum]